MLAWPAAWNGYPAMFADSGTYLGQAIQGYLGWDRPAFYSLFLHSLHMRLSLWPIPVVQGLVVAHVLALCLRILGRPGATPILLAGFGLGSLSSLPFFAAQIMPDVFTGVLVLCMWLLAHGWEWLSRREQLYVACLATGCVAVHQAHLPLAGGLALALGLLAVFGGQGFGALRRMVVPPVVAALALLAHNSVGHGKVSLSPYGSIFAAARVIYDGPGRQTLAEQCAVRHWRICEVRDRLPPYANAFLWYANSPLWDGTLGGAKAWGPEAGEVVRATIATRPLEVAQAMAANTLRQIGMMATGDGLEPWRGTPGPEPVIEQFFAQELAAFRGARQWQGSLVADAESLAPLHLAVAWTGLILAAVAIWPLRRRQPAAAHCVAALLAALGNAAITGGRTGPHHRYQARIAWLFAFAPAAALVARRPAAAAHPAVLDSMPGSVQKA